MDKENYKDAFMSVVYVMLEYGVPIPENVFQMYKDILSEESRQEDLLSAANKLFEAITDTH